MTATAELNSSAMSAAPRTKTSTNNEAAAAPWCTEERRTSTTRTGNPAFRQKKSTLKSKLLKLGPMKRDTSLTSDSSSITTSSTLDDADSHPAAAGVLIRQLPVDRQPLLPPRSPLQKQQIVESLQHQFSPRLLMPTPSELPSKQVDPERFLGPIDLDGVSGDDEEGFEVVDAGGLKHVHARLAPKVNKSALNVDDEHELDMFLRRWQASNAQFREGSPLPVDVDTFLSDVCFSPEDYEEFILDEVELCRELVGYQEGCEPELITDCSLMTWNEEDEENDNIRKDASRPPSTSAATANSKSTPGLKQKRPPSSTPTSISSGSRPPSATYSRTYGHRPAQRMYSVTALPPSAAEV
jgi:hypothetical protein